MADTLTRIVVRNSAVGLAGQLTTKLLSFGFSVLIVRNLGVEAYGQYAAVLSFGAVFIFLADLGLNLYAVRQVARLREQSEADPRIHTLYSDVFALRFLLTLVTIAVTLIAAWMTGRPPIMVGAIALSGLGLVMYSLQGPCEAVLFGFERADLVAGSKVMAQLVFVVAGGAALVLGYGYYGLIVANLIGVALMTVNCWQAVKRLGIQHRMIAPIRWPALLRASLPFGVVGLMLGLSYKLDTVLLNVYRGDVETGYYNAAYGLVFSASLMSTVVNTSLYPSLARQAASGAGRLASICASAFRFLMLLSLPFALGGCLLADRVVPFLYTDEYSPASDALRIVIWVVPLMFASEFLQYVALVRGQERLVARSVAISTGINVALNVLLVPSYGIVAAAAVTVVTELVLVSQYAWIHRILLAQFDWTRIVGRPLLAATLMATLAYNLSFIPFIAVLTLSGLVFAALVVILRVVTHSEVQSGRDFALLAMSSVARRLRPWNTVSDRPQGASIRTSTLEVTHGSQRT